MAELSPLLRLILTVAFAAAAMPCVRGCLVGRSSPRWAAMIDDGMHAAMAIDMAVIVWVAHPVDQWSAQLTFSVLGCGWFLLRVSGAAAQPLLLALAPSSTSATRAAPMNGIQRTQYLHHAALMGVMASMISHGQHSMATMTMPQSHSPVWRAAPLLAGYCAVAVVVYVLVYARSRPPAASHRGVGIEHVLLTAGMGVMLLAMT